ncbi:hypothetical protein BDZ85DRAFT_281168 [Elsinoe ampelina]|uniref:BZIP domain-containing protein n=1 Tax=Elsinoe ampelina TaxID=302913 RepID=A0A6A6GFZ2_9PEZI|nr:hypothetical protein BDZ85DRAFT_281168 [Elsinoe ampelina]
MSIIAPPPPPGPAFERSSFSLPSLQHSFSASSIPGPRRSPPSLPGHNSFPEASRTDGQRKRAFAALEDRPEPITGRPMEGYGKGNLSGPVPTPSPHPPTPADRFSKPLHAPQSPLSRTGSRPFLHPHQSPYLNTQRQVPPSPRSQLAAPDPRYPSPTGYFPPINKPSAPSSQSRQDQGSPGTEPTGRYASGSVSPIGSYSPYSQNDRTSPNTQGPPPAYQMEHMSLSKSPHQRGRSPSSHYDGPYSGGIPITTPGGSAAYSMMTVQTASGAVQVPVDMQAASRLADEKRRRNAGASARFRERRKKKEMESSATIRKLENQVKELSEDLEYYRRERDYMANAIMQAPGAERHFPRPSSPRSRRGPPSTPGDMSDRGFDFVQEKPDSRDDNRNVRRRTSSFHGQSEPSSAGGIRTPVVPHSGPSQYAYPAQQGPAPSPWSRIEYPLNSIVRPEQGRDSYPPPPVRTQLPPLNLPPIMQATPPTGPHNPYAGHRLDKPWPHGPPPHYPRDPR